MGAPAREETAMPSAHSMTQRLMDDIIEKIRSGEWPPDYRLPSARELRKRYECSQAVVRTAIDRLRAAGWVVSAPGIGVFVAPDPPM